MIGRKAPSAKNAEQPVVQGELVILDGKLGSIYQPARNRSNGSVRCYLPLKTLF